MAYAFNDDKSKVDVTKGFAVRKTYTAQSSSPTITYTYSELGLTAGKRYTGFATMGPLIQGKQVGCGSVPISISETNHNVSFSTSMTVGATVDIRYMFFEL